MTDYVKLAGIKIPTIVAITTDEQERGLMGYNWPPPVMSFIYASPRINKFWMKATPAPLDIVFCNNSIITAICSGEPNSTEIIGDNRPSDLVVEFPAGTCKAYGVKIGDQLELECGDDSLMKILMLKNGFSF